MDPTTGKPRVASARPKLVVVNGLGNVGSKRHGERLKI